MVHHEERRLTEPERRSRKRRLHNAASFLRGDAAETTSFQAANSRVHYELKSVNTVLVDSGEPPKEIEVAQGCLLVPIVFAIWWYWTKRTARRLAKNLLRMNHHPSATHPHEHGNPSLDEGSPPRRVSVGDTTIIDSPYTTVDESVHDDDMDEENPVISSQQDAFQSWDDVLQQNTRDDSTHFVRWIRTAPTSFCSNRDNNSNQQRRSGKSRRQKSGKGRGKQQNARGDLSYTGSNLMDKGLLEDSAPSGEQQPASRSGVSTMGSFDDPTPTLAAPTSSSATDNNNDTEKAPSSLGWQHIEYSNTDSENHNSNIPSYQHQAATSARSPLGRLVERTERDNKTRRNQLDQIL